MDRPLGALTRLLAVLLAVLLAWPVLVPGTARADVPVLRAGAHAIALPADAPATFRLPRTTSGSTLHVALWYVGAGGSVGAGVRLTLGTAPDDTGCGGGGVFRPTVGEPAPLLVTSASTWTDAPGHPCESAEELFVTIGEPSDPVDRGRAATLLVYEEPPLPDYSFDLLREPTVPGWRALEPAASPRPVEPGRTPADAPVLDPGSYRLRLRPGRTAVLAVPLDWDQSLRAGTDGAPAPELTILGPMLGDDVALTAPGRAQSHVTSYLHRNSLDPARAGAALSGVRYLLVSLPAAAARATTVTLTVAVDGSPGEGVPDYAVTDAALPPRADSRLVDGSLRAAPDPEPTARHDDADEEDGATAVWLGVGMVVALGAVVLVVRRRARPTRRGARVRGR